MRVDANVSVRRAGAETLGTRCEIKNLNSIRSLGRAIEYEARRQIDLLEAGDRVRQETRHWDEDDGRTHTLRSKEDADDYRYFPEPDLVPLEPDDAWISRVRVGPAAAARRPPRRPRVHGRRRHRRPVRSPSPWSAASTNSRSRRSRPAATRAACSPTSSTTSPSTAPRRSRPAALAAARRGWRSTASSPRRRPRPCSPSMVETAAATRSDRRRRRASRRWTTGALEAVVDEVIAAHPDEWAAYRAGDDKARGKLTGFFVGEVMKATKGQADGKAVTARLRELAG